MDLIDRVNVKILSAIAIERAGTGNIKSNLYRKKQYKEIIKEEVLDTLLAGKNIIFPSDTNGKQN